MRFRGLIWLVALCAFLLPPAIAPAAAMASGDRVTMSDCPDHAPPPAPCPDKGSAKHAAGLCCPAMAQVVAVLPVVAVTASRASHDARGLPAARDLTGLSPHMDPPPPRV
jgi:hypothetical protein